jgi:hypothetical protein
LVEFIDQVFCADSAESVVLPTIRTLIPKTLKQALQNMLLLAELPQSSAAGNSGTRAVKGVVGYLFNELNHPRQVTINISNAMLLSIAGDSICYQYGFF